MAKTTFTPAALTAVGLDPNDIQGLLLRGYPSHGFSCHMLFQFKNNKAGASAFIKAIYGQVQNATNWPPPPALPPASFLQIGLTITGIGTLKPTLNKNNFPRAFVNGPVSPGSQASLLDNFGPSLPTNWTFGSGTKTIDCVVHVYANSAVARDTLVNTIAAAASSNKLVELMPTTTAGRLYQTQQLPQNFVHFDFRDGIDNPDLDPNPPGNPTPQGALNNFLIGYNTSASKVSPQPTAGAEGTFAKNGFYNAFRILFQDTVGFNNFLTANVPNVPTTVTADKKEWLKAKMNGRWTQGSPLVEAPTANDPTKETDTVFDYSTDVAGTKCPYGAHTRITNPRNDNQVFPMKQPIIRLLRRGVAYGDPNTTGQPDNVDRGLIGIFLCGGILEQFETMYSWLNVGSTLFQNPPYAVTQDPLSANYQYNASTFAIPMDGAPNVVLQLGGQSFVQTRGTAYLLMPSMTALRSCFS